MLRQTQVRHALHRPNLMLGCDRELVLFSGLLCGVLIYTALTGGYVFIALLAAYAWKRVVGYLREMAKADPRMRQIYIRHLLYRPYYPARSTPFCRK